MKLRSITAVAAIAAGAACVGAAGVAVLYGGGWIECLVLGALSWGVVFLVGRWAVRNFVIYKIKPIYQIVLSRDMNTGDLSRHLSGHNKMIDQMQTELSERAEVNRSEIARLKDNEKYRREFLGNISHEMKTPIFTLQGYILTLLDGAVDDTKINRKYLERSEKAIDRMIDIVTDLEEISKLEAGVLELHCECFDIAQLARDIATDASLEADKHEITICVGNGPGTDAPQPPVWVSADRKYIERVLTNLIINSIRYGSRGGHTQVSFVDLFDTVMVEVADTGIGISSQEVSRVFERFYRADKSRSREVGGTGLGLSIVKHIIEAHNQQITLRSQLGVGTTFSFTLAGCGDRPPGSGFAYASSFISSRAQNLVKKGKK